MHDKVLHNMGVCCVVATSNKFMASGIIIFLLPVIKLDLYKVMEL